MDRIGKYDILGELGKGGMGTVYKGRDTIIGREVAIKVIRERALQDPSIKKRFYREARSAGRLSHPNITIIYDVSEENETPYLVMEYLAGTDLHHLLKSGTSLTTAQKLSIAAQICSGLQYAHNNEVIHRDIKPENIQVLPNGTVKIMDFGIARIQDETQALTMTNTSVGTPRYMAPEQVKGETIDHRADIFSFGVLFYELLTGINPFSGDNITTIIYKILNTEPKPIELAPDALCADLQAIVSKCLKKNPDERYTSFIDVQRDVQAITIPEDVRVAEDETALMATIPTPTSLQAPPQPNVLSPSEPAALPRSASSRNRLWAAFGILLILGLGIGGYFVFRPSPPPEVAGIIITPSEATVEAGEVLRLNAELRDSQGAAIGPAYLSAYEVQWTSADTMIAAVTPALGGEDLGATVAGHKRGSTTITATVGEHAQSVPVEVTISIETLNLARQHFTDAQAELSDASVQDSVVLTHFERLKNDLGYALDEDHRADVEQKIQQLSTLIATFNETTRLDQSDSLSILEKRASWQAFLDQAFRESPARQQAEEKLQAFDEMGRRSALLEEGSFTTCDQAVPGGSTGALRVCRDGAVAERFPPGTSVYFNARVDAPRSTTIRWEWLDAQRVVVKQHRTSVMGVQGYRIWDLLSSSDTRQTGRYQIRIYNEENLLIGRHVFTIR